MPESKKESSSAQSDIRRIVDTNSAEGLIRVNESNPMSHYHYAYIIQAYEAGTADWAEEDYSLVS